MFSKQQLEAIAEVLRVRRPKRPLKPSGYLVGRAGIIARRYHHRIIVDELADLFARDNPRFDRERFLAACREG